MAPDDPALRKVNSDTATAITAPYAVNVVIPGGTVFRDDGKFQQKVLFRNLGTQDDNYQLSASSQSGWVELEVLPGECAVNQVEILLSRARPKDTYAIEVLELRAVSRRQRVPREAVAASVRSG